MSRLGCICCVWCRACDRNKFLFPSSSCIQCDIWDLFLTRGATFPGMPPQFAYPAAFGDLLTAILAFAAIPFVLRRSVLAKPAVWVFNMFGTLDLLAAITFATIYNAPVTMGPAYWIPAFWVPLLLVTHYVTFVLLGRRWQP